MAALSKMQRYEVLRGGLEQDFNTFKPQYQDLNDFILPSRGRFFITDNNRGDRRNNKIYDPTAYLSARTLSAGMMAGITSPARNWKRLTTPDPDLSEVGPVKEWLNVVDQRMSNIFLRSNLYNVLPTLYGDLGVFGTAAMMMEEDQENVCRFYSFPIGTFRIAKDVRGHVNVFLRDFRLTVRQVVEQFGQKDGAGNPDWSNISQNVRSLWDQCNYEAWIDVTHIIEPNQDYNPKFLHSKFKKFSSCYFERGTGSRQSNGQDVLGGVFLRERGYDYFPVLVPRWQVTGMDVYGTDCPGMAAIGDIKQLQHGEKRIAQAIDKMVNPAMLATSNLKTSKASIISGDITYIDDFGREGFKPVHEIKIDLSHIEQKQAQVRQRIQRAFFEDLFLMLAQSDRSQFTATEILERKEEKLLAVGPVLEQLNQDVLDPLIDNLFALMQMQGLVPPAPQELQGQELKVEYISVMAQAQKMIGVGGLDRLLQIGGQIAQFTGAWPKKINKDHLIDSYGDSLGAPPKVIRTDEEVAAMEQQEQQAAAAQQKMEAIQQATQSAKNLSQTDLGGNNALARLTQQYSGQV